ncbi:MAG: S26 family signal peptidase [Anaerolineales bacterium]|nr:S26 family signal peptidase [Anaerolineae bacterium]PWB53505.1 MAG: S26 family signal peptidase [Anaerolineales bacterium]
MLKFLKIVGESLSPGFEHGDFVLVSKIPFLFSPPAVGDVIAFHQPGYGTLIKRIQAVDTTGMVEVIGTQPDSTDSRVFGPVRRKNIIGKVVWHIHKT